MDMDKAHRVLVLGGVRSGKSELAERLVRSWDRGEVTYLATGEARDEEMALRIQRHRQRRPATWRTWEGDPEDLPGAVRPLGGVLLLDCLTLWLSRLLLRTPAAEGDHEGVWQEAQGRILDLGRELLEAPAPGVRMVLVTNEVGFCPVPPNRLGRRFQELQGRMNRLAAERADRVVLVTAGIPLWIKGAGEEP